MDMITQQIFIANNQEVRNIKLLKQNGITAVLNVARDIDIVEWFVDEASRTHFKDVEYQKVGIVDGPGNEISELATCVFTLRHLLTRHKRVAIICHEGVSRSVIVAASYHSHVYKEPFQMCLDAVKNRRSVANPKEELIQLALQFEVFLKEEGAGL